MFVFLGKRMLFLGKGMVILMKKDLIKNEIVTKFSNIITTWEVEDIYVISFFVYDLDDDPSKPTVTLGYNTEQEVSKNLKYSDDPEIRWNYAFWLQNDEGSFGVDKASSKLVKEWIKENCDNHKNHSHKDSNTKLGADLSWITESFVQILIEVVKEIQNSGILKDKFQRDIPILIHELEYYDKIAEQNIEANGAEIVKDFVDFVNGLYVNYY